MKHVSHAFLTVSRGQPVTRISQFSTSRSRLIGERLGRSWSPIRHSRWHGPRGIGPRFSDLADLSGSSVRALPEQARNARLKLRANRRKARCSGSPTEVDDRSSSSPFSSPPHSLPHSSCLPALSLPPFDLSATLSCLFSPYPSSNLSIGLSPPPVLPLYRTPTSRGQLALVEHEYTTPRSCRWT